MRAMTALLLLGPGTPMLFQGQEFGVVGAVPVFRRSRRPSWRRRSRRGRARVPRAVPQPRDAGRCRRRSPTPRDPTTLRALQARLARAGRARGTSVACTAICSRCAASDAAFAAQAADGARRRRARRARRSCCATSAPRPHGRSPAGRQSRAATSIAPSFAEPLLAPPDGMRLGGALVERGRRVRRRRHARRSRPTSGLARFPAHAARDAGAGREAGRMAPHATATDRHDCIRCARMAQDPDEAATQSLVDRSGWSPTVSAATRRARSPAC